jgi:hypothetical protein
MGRLVRGVIRARIAEDFGSERFAEGASAGESGLA